MYRREFLKTSSMAVPAMLLSPKDSFAAARTLEEILQIGTDAFFDPNTGAATIENSNGKPFMLVPWYSSSSQKNLKSFDRVRNPSASNYAMVSDELSEIALLVSIGNNPGRMQAVYNTIDAMRGDHGYLPGWVAEVKDKRISLISRDSASDASARFILTLYQASKNPNFSEQDRIKYKEGGDQLAKDHLQYEYSRGNYKSDLTGRTLDVWGAGGGNTITHNEKSFL